jgi:hypothetical protein
VCVCVCVWCVWVPAGQAFKMHSFLTRANAVFAYVSHRHHCTQPATVPLRMHVHMSGCAHSLAFVSLHWHTQSCCVLASDTQTHRHTSHTLARTASHVCTSSVRCISGHVWCDNTRAVAALQCSLVLTCACSIDIFSQILSLASLLASHRAQHRRTASAVQISSACVWPSMLTC